MFENEDRIRERAYRIWVEEGRPEGRAEEQWEMARELVAIEESQDTALKSPYADTGDVAEPAEPIEAIENQGEFPVLADQGEKRMAPKARKPRKTNAKG